MLSRWWVAVIAICALAAGCDDKKDSAAGSSSATPAATPPGSSSATAAAPAAASASAAPAASGGPGSKCKDAAEHKARLKDPKQDPATLGSVGFDKLDCETGKWSSTKADCILAAKDYDTAKKCP
jgi:hypothetical protein